ITVSEPPIADPHDGWCGGCRRETCGYPIITIVLMMLLLSGCFTESATNTIEHTENAISINLSHNGEYVLIAYSQGHVELRQTKNNDVIAQWQHADSPKAGVIAADFSKNNQFVVTAEQGTLALFSLKEKKYSIFGLWMIFAT
ncbi:MAG: hypothetical protein KZQ70_15720, partial [gamma proteobacterium symbiont of Lucinoma myriamae]|nr:hypothetical protein [gamma proteobacterium symbiont of Lucinoma myriamae]MCU7833580.1 hypothetical protein [gamma proteobacterium symbiont of Lucinoma myriamae]